MLKQSLGLLETGKDQNCLMLFPLFDSNSFKGGL